MVMASLLGLGAFLYPFFRPSVEASGMMAHASDAPLLFVLLLVLCLGAVFASLTGGQMTSKMVAVLGILTALSAVLRAVPGPAGFNAIFLLPILAGYCFGPTFGFLLGALSLLVSALIGGGVGPWLPYQMFSTGWVGMLSGWLPEFPRHRRWEPVMLAVWGFTVGLLFGAIMNIWFWPFLAGGAQQGQGWQPGMSIWPTRAQLSGVLHRDIAVVGYGAGDRQRPAAPAARRAGAEGAAPLPQPVPVRDGAGGSRGRNGRSEVATK